MVEVGCHNFRNSTKAIFDISSTLTMNNVDLIRLHISTAVIILSIIVLDADITLFEQDRKWYDETLRWGSGIPVRSVPKAGVVANMLTCCKIPKARVDYGDLHPGNYQLRDPKWPLLRPILFVVFFLLIMLISVGHIVLLVKGMLLARRRGDTGRASKLTKVGLYSAALSFLLAFVAVVYGWHGAGTKFTLQEVYDNSVHTSYMKGKDEVTNFRDPTGPLAALDSFTWYCALVGPVAYGLTRIGNQFTFAINMDFLCKKGECTKKHAS